MCASFVSFELELAGVDVRRLPVSFGGLFKRDVRRLRIGCETESFDGVDVDWGDGIGSDGGGDLSDFICIFIVQMEKARKIRIPNANKK